MPDENTQKSPNTTGDGVKSTQPPTTGGDKHDDPLELTPIHEEHNPDGD